MVKYMNYPGGMKKKQTREISYGNRGMSLESDINESNMYYQVHDIAYIYKKPTPITVSRVDYRSRMDAKIIEAYYKTPSTTDYNGVYKGYYIDFEAKETRSKTLFPLSNIHVHQIKHLENIRRHGGIGFVIIRFSTLNLTYYLDGSKLQSFLERTTRKSIPLAFFQKEGYLIKDQYQPRLDYLSIVDYIYFKGEAYEQSKKNY